MNIIRNSLIVSLLVVLVLPTSLAFASGIEDVKGVNYAHCESNEFAQANSLGYSGDDLYDSAADLLCAEASAEINTFSTSPELSVAQRYAVAAPVSAAINTFSVNPELSVAQRYAEAMAKKAEDSETNNLSASPELAWVHGSFSGDDAYDPSVLDVPGSSEALSGGSFSGDDDYDLSAGAVL